MNFVRPREFATQGTDARDPHPAHGALIVGGADVTIGIARSLGRHGIPVWLLADHPIPKFSRYVQRSFAWPGADHQRGVASIIDIAARYGLDNWVLFATGDEGMRMIAQNHALVASHFHVTTEHWDTAQWLYDKRLTYQRAASLGIECPSSFYARDLGEVQRLDCRFPVILKAAFRSGVNAFTRAKAWKADNRDALLSLYQRAATLVGKDAVIIQEWIPGAGESQFSYAGLWNRGEAVISLVARRTRQYPIDFGRSSTFVETVEQDQIEELACRFLKSLNYTGVAEVEFKYDRRDRQFKLLDVNGRFWTWNGLGALAGVDFPYLAWRQALGLTVLPDRAKTGVAWMHASRDIVAAYQEMSRGLTTVGDFLGSLRKPLAFATFALDDPLPAIFEIPVAAWKSIKNGFAERTENAD